jgi:citrate lyase beta subunit
MAAVSRDFGFQAATCLNHAQVAVINSVYAGR